MLWNFEVLIETFSKYWGETIASKINIRHRLSLDCGLLRQIVCIFFFWSSVHLSGNVYFPNLPKSWESSIQDTSLQFWMFLFCMLYNEHKRTYRILPEGSPRFLVSRNIILTYCNRPAPFCSDRASAESLWTLGP